MLRCAGLRMSTRLDACPPAHGKPGKVPNPHRATIPAVSRIIVTMPLSLVATTILTSVDWNKIFKNLATDAAGKGTKNLLARLQPDDREKSAKAAVKIFVEEFTQALEDKLPAPAQKTRSRPGRAHVERPRPQSPSRRLRLDPGRRQPHASPQRLRQPHARNSATNSSSR